MGSRQVRDCVCGCQVRVTAFAAVSCVAVRVDARRGIRFANDASLRVIFPRDFICEKSND